MMGTILNKHSLQNCLIPLLSVFSKSSFCISKLPLYQASGQVEMYRHVMEHACVWKLYLLNYVMSSHDEMMMSWAGLWSDISCTFERSMGGFDLSITWETSVTICKPGKESSSHHLSGTLIWTSSSYEKTHLGCPVYTLL